MSGVESDFGKCKVGDNGESLGLLQIQPRTARWISNKYKSLAWVKNINDKQLRYLLEHNDNFNIMIASLLFEYNKSKYGYTVAISKHNGGTHNTEYVESVLQAKNSMILMR